MTDKRHALIGDVYESTDMRDTDPAQPNGLRRVKVIDFVFGKNPAFAQVVNLTTNRKTAIQVPYLLSSKWKLIV
jgi:hypothetical protein